MQLSTPAVYFKLGVVTAALGALVAGGISFTLPKRYVSAAVLQVRLPTGESDGSAVLAARQIQTLQQEVLSRSSLAEIIQRPSLDLYQEERAHYPMEDVIEGMRNRDLRIQAVEGGRFRISFEYKDPAKAQGAVHALAARFVEQNLAARVGVIEVLDPASLPKAEPRNIPGLVALGFGAGFALGLFIAFLRGRSLRWTLSMAAHGAAGAIAGFAIAAYFDVDPVPLACLGSAAGLTMAAFLMRDRAAWRPAPYLKSALACGVAAAIVAGFASYAFPERYVSTGLLRVFQQGAFGVPAPDATGAASERMRRSQQEVLSRHSLAELIQRPSLDLYRNERQRQPIDDIVQGMRRAIRMQPARDGSAFSISFEYRDPAKAQAVVRELVTKFVELNVSMEHALGHNATQPDALMIEVIDPPNLPTTPASSNRLRVIALGLAAGIPLGLLVAYLRRRPPGQAGAMLRFAAASGIAGALLAVAVSFAIPNRYVSTAVLRVVRADDQSGSRLQEIMMQVLSRQNLSDEMRRAVRIQSLEVGPHGQTTAFSISFEAPDPAKAHSAVQTLVTHFVEHAEPDTSALEVLDPATISDLPVFPNRSFIALAGLLAGVLAGGWWGGRSHSVVRPRA